MEEYLSNALKLHPNSLFLLFIFIVPVWSHADEPLTWGYGHFPPYLYIQEDGKPHGPYADIVKGIFKHAGIEYKSLLAPNRRLRKMMTSGLIDFAVSPKYNLGESTSFYYSRAKVATIDLRVYWIGENPVITKASDLNNQSVIMISSYEYSGLRNYIENPDNNVDLAVDVEDHERALLALSLKRGTYLLAYRAPVDLIQLEMNIQELNSFPLIQTDMYLIINKSVKNSRQIMDKLETSYSTLNANKLNN